MKMKWVVKALGKKGVNRAVLILPRITECPPSLSKETVSLSLASYGNCMTPIGNLEKHDSHTLPVSNYVDTVNYANRIMGDIVKQAKRVGINISLDMDIVAKAIKDAFEFSPEKEPEKKELPSGDSDELTPEELEVLSLNAESTKSAEDNYQKIVSDIEIIKRNGILENDIIEPQ